MKWREVSDGDRWHRRKVYKGKKKGWNVKVEATYEDIWTRKIVNGYYFVANNEKIDKRYNSLWGEVKYSTIEDAQTAAEEWIDGQCI